MLDTNKPFKLANVTINPATDEITFDGNTIEIKSMAMKVICYFAAHSEQVITRDNLREDVWQNSTASNHTINNHIYSLRQTLAKLDSQTKFFHTVTGSQSGYRLIATVSQQSQLTTAPTDEITEGSTQSSRYTAEYNHSTTDEKTDLNSTRTINKQTYVKALIASVLLSLIIVLIYVVNIPKTYQHSSVLTTQQGREQSPAISQDGEILIYSNRTSRNSTWELYASKMQAPLQVQKVFDSGDNKDNFVSISPNKRYIAFIRRKAAKGIYIADFNAKRLTASNAKLIIPLNKTNLSPAISWLDDSQFYYSAREAVSAPLRIYLYDLALDRSEQITSPPLDLFGDIGNLGDYAAMVSPNKNWLAIMRSKKNAGYQLYLYDLVNKTLVATKVESLEERLNISFSDDSKEIYFVDQQGYLSSYHLQEQTIVKLSAKQYLGYWPLKVPKSNQFIMQQDWGLSSLTTQIIKINNPILGGDGTAAVIVNNNLSIRAIAGIGDDGLIFASIKPNYQVELWKFSEGKAAKLVEFNEKPEYRYPLSLHWRKGTQSALFSINKTCRIINISNGKDSPLCPDNENLYAGRFSYDGNDIYLPGFAQGNARAVKMGGTGYPIKELPQLAQANLVHENSDGSFYYSKEVSFDIYYVNAETGQEHKIIDRTYINNRYSVNDFVVTAKGIYFMDRVAVTQNAIYFYEFASQKVIYVVKSKDNYPNIVVSQDEKSIFLIESVDNNTSLLLID
ncbi:winged helix-turn-helix domain-containing protein [Colwellia psychrerythraea]|uniref:Transcriptional regulator, winged helix family n=1 Tax=Colwellia psychrerythraea TaxID=28229 RepID=A0A099KAA6_COLPS|nr:winged helix-turn-helix domain-containing protein [Colwellia psychrerythraea]KGJ86538.1 transcriptional regulator, winged helix family [Colwellia psychrerythraea]